VTRETNVIAPTTLVDLKMALLKTSGGEDG
jgi:hypothetical protein